MRQFSTIMRRQVRRIFADRGYFAFLALLPFILGVLSLAVCGPVGFGIPDLLSDAPNEPCAAAVIQSAVLVAIVVFGKGGPTQGAVFLQRPSVEVFVDIAATCVASVILGLASSALARSNEQIMPLLVVSVMAQLVFSGA